MVNGRALAAFRARLRGQVVLPGDPGCDRARAVWNATADAHPAVVARCPGVGELDRQAQAVGPACPTGHVSHTGVGGLTLGGGVGRPTRRHGLTLDNLAAVELVRAEGERVRADAGSEPELVWGLRGAGANFGVATAFELRLHRSGRWSWPASPSTRSSGPARSRPPSPPAWPPPPTRSRPGWLVGGPTRPAVPAGGRRPPGGSGQRHQCRPAGRRRARPGPAAGPRPGPGHLRPSPLPGAPGRERPSLPLGPARLLEGPDDATAFSGRGATLWLITEAVWDDPAEDPARIAWGRQAMAALRPFATTVNYINDLGQLDQDAVRAACGPAKYDRLAALKRVRDPEKVFRRNRNIRP